MPHNAENADNPQKIPPVFVPSPTRKTELQHMELSKNFEPQALEHKWYKHWLDKKYFNSTPDERPAFTVVIPPPNVTGVLHMGHTLNETVQDILVRKARMSGFNACWVPGSDHASIATEAKVVQMLKEKGIDKNSLTREAFLKYAFEWKEKYGGIIYNQIERLGCSVDWNRTTFTMDDHYYEAVLKVFEDLYGKGLIYRGARMINWDVAAKTALSDEEVEYKDLEGKLYHLNYFLSDENGKALPEFISIATQRPETIMGDTAICVNPNDERYTKLKGAFALVPLINRSIPIIFDEYVDPTFGTGALKVTPAHDINDYNLGLKHNLEVIDTLNADGTLSAAAQIYVGEDRFVVRKKIIKELLEKGHLTKEETYQTRLGYSQRTGVVVEPRISTQWFVKMKDLAQPALDAVVNGDISIHPGDKFLATYKYWLENVKDWCISRQLWWGQQIPAWYDAEGRMVVATTETEAYKKYYELTGQTPPPSGATEQGEGWEHSSGKVLTQDEDVLDTWFSSWLWPMEVFNGISNPGNAEATYYYPGNVLVTGQDIIFFWVARMVMAGMEYEKQIPFKDVYFTGMVRDKQGRKMSKSLGNSPDLLELIDKYGADAVRFGIMISSPAGNDLLYDEGSLEQGRNFNNKMWNALKLVQSWKLRVQHSATTNAEQATENFATLWFQNRLSEARIEVDELMKQFRLSEALKTIYSLIWDDFCSWYLEWVKPGFEQPIEAAVYAKTVGFFTDLMQLLHPYMPFVTEEIYHLLEERTDDLCVKQYAPQASFSIEVLEKGQILKDDITAIRDTRKKYEIKNIEKLDFMCNPAAQFYYGNNNDSLQSLLLKQTNITYFISPNVNEIIEEYSKNEVAVTSSERTFFLHLNKQIDVAAQKSDLQKDLDHQKGFLLSVEKKLGNEKFIQHAKPEVLALEQKKRTDALLRIKSIEDSLSKL
jgi:valyl-tRNA synthetase